MAGEFDGQVALVTGGGRGFGRAIAEEFARQGAAVAVTSRTKSQLDETVAAIEAAGGKALAVPGDVTNRDDVVRTKREIEAALGPVNTVVSNAGVPWPFGPLWEVDPDRWWEAQAIHVRGAMLHMNTYVPGMIEQGGGRIIVVSSNASQHVGPYVSAYAVAKHTQNRLVEHLAAEAGEHNIFTWAIQPGFVVTELADLTSSDPAAQKYLSGFVGRIEEARANEDPQVGLQRCADLCVELASGRCDPISGRFLTPEDDLASLVKQAATAG
jgi:3-oxoacyl-[acyl-carrier protein] reductase